ncbi:MAG: peptidase M20 [Rhodobacteraceae bacterium]|nr:peptidase M20 [Paracoccaceae bacterium]
MLDRAALSALLSDLIRARSPDPPGDEAEICAVLADRLRGLGFAPEVEEFAPRRFNLLVRLKGAGARPGLVFSAHMDTLPAGDPAGWRRDPFSGEDDGARLHGRGACDMKSGLAALISALTALRESPPPGDVTLAVTGGESANLIGARRLVETGALAGHGAILVGEPTSLDLVTATTSALWLRAEARGTVGHGSDGTGGTGGTGGADGAGGPAVNAIVALARALDGLETALPEATHPLLGGATLNIGRIEGGAAINLMPDRCAADLDLRLPPGVTAKAAETALAARLGPGIRLTRLDWKPAQETAPDAPLARACLAAASRVRGAAAVPRGARYFTDACILAPAFGLETATLGPGRLGGSGEADESVVLADVETAARIYAETARAWSP